MSDIDITHSVFRQPSSDGPELVSVQPEIDPKIGITNRYQIVLSNPDVSFLIEKDKTGSWKCLNIPDGLDPDFIPWVGDEIEKYYQ